MKRTASAVWVGGPRAGEGSVSSASGVFRNVIYTFGTTAIDVPCTNPCEMLAAAEAACMSLMVAKELAADGIMSDKIETRADLTISEEKDGWSSPKIHLTLKAFVSDEVETETFDDAIQRARKSCPITRSLKSEITMETILEPVAAEHRVAAMAAAAPAVN